MLLILTMRVLILIIQMLFYSCAIAQDSTGIKKANMLNTQSILLVQTQSSRQDSATFKTPRYRQGFFCDFEDKLNRKKVPVDFSLGNSKY